MTKIIKSLPLLLVFCGLFWLGSEQQDGEAAYVLYPGPWAGDSADYRVNNNFPASAGSSAAVLAEMQLGAGSWTTQACADFQFNYQGSSSLTTVADDGTNVVFWDPTSGGATIATTTVRLNTGAGGQLFITSFDMRWWGNHNLKTVPILANEIDIQGIAAHEFGHALGLDHSSLSPNSSATMNSSVTPGPATILLRTLEQEDIDGAVFWYGSDLFCTAQPGIPTPNPMSFSSPPAVLGANTVIMTATTATAPGPGPVEYFFEVVGLPVSGADSSSWQSSPTYIDPGVQPGTTPFYRVHARNAVFPADQTTPSSAASVSIPSGAPGLVSVDNVTNHEFTISNLDPNGNFIGVAFAVGVNSQYVGSTGALQATPAYLSASGWNGKVVTGLSRETVHAVRAQAAFGPGGNPILGPITIVTTKLLGPCADGNVSNGSGGLQDDILKVNGSSGDVNKRVFVTPGTPLTISFDQPLTNANPANWILWGHTGTPQDDDEFILPSSIGQMCIRPCELVMFPEHFTLGSTYGDLGCGLLLPASLTPYSLTVPGIMASLPPIAFQGVIEISPGSLGVTNAVIFVNQ